MNGIHSSECTNRPISPFLPDVLFSCTSVSGVMSSPAKSPYASVVLAQKKTQGADKGAFFAKGGFPGGPEFAKGADVAKPGQKGKGPMGKIAGKSPRKLVFIDFPDYR